MPRGGKTGERPLVKCDVCGKSVKYLKRHKCESKSAGGSFPIQSQSPLPADTSFPTMDKVLPDRPSTEPPRSQPPKTGKGAVYGLAGFFVTAAEWINSFWVDPPKIKCDDATARRLEQQFNDAFGVMVHPILGFCLSMFLVFGWPILAHVLGKDFVNGLIRKMRDGFKKKMGKKEDDK